MTPGDDSLIEAYLRYLRGQGHLPDLDGLEPEEAAEARELFELLDATADMGRELPAFEDDPVAHALGLVPGDGDSAPRGIRRGGQSLKSSPSLSLVAPVVPGEEEKRNRGEGRRGSSRGRGTGRGFALAAVAAVVALVVLAVAPGGVLRGTTPAGALESGTLTSRCDTTFRGGGGEGDAKDHVVVAAVWADEERSRFMEVLQRFSNETGIDVSFATDPAEADRDIAETLQTLGRNGCAPDVALLPQPGLLAHLAKSGNILPIDHIVGNELERNYSTAWQELGKVKGQSYGVWFKAANKSLIWYNANAFRRAGIERPPADLRGLMDAAERLLAVGSPRFQSAAGARTAGS